MLTDFSTALDGARTLARVDEIARAFWGAVAAGSIGDADAERIDAAIAAARQRVKAAAEARERKPSPARRRREKVFGDGRPQSLDRNAKVRVMHLARGLARRTEPGKAYGALTAKFVAVLETLLWGFHNARSGVCIPSYETIARRADCARSTVGEALKALEASGVMTWVNRLARIRERCAAVLGGTRTRVIRTSNGYAFHDPKGAAARQDSSKSDLRSGTSNQESFSYKPQSSKAAFLKKP